MAALDVAYDPYLVRSYNSFPLCGCLLARSVKILGIRPPLRSRCKTLPHFPQFGFGCLPRCTRLTPLRPPPARSCPKWEDLVSAAAGPPARHGYFRLNAMGTDRYHMPGEERAWASVPEIDDRRRSRCHAVRRASLTEPLGGGECRPRSASDPRRILPLDGGDRCSGDGRDIYFEGRTYRAHILGTSWQIYGLGRFRQH